MAEGQKVQMAEGFLPLKVSVSKKVEKADGTGNEYQEVGEIAIPIPTLKAFGVSAETRTRTDDDGEDDGLPIYADPKLDWVFQAIVALCKAKARNKLISGTAELKEGQKIASTLEELMAEGERVGGGEAMKLFHEVVKSFASFVQGLGKSAQTQGVLVGLFKNRQALALQSASTKEKFKKYLSDYAATLEEADLLRYQRPLELVEQAASADTPDDF